MMCDVELDWHRKTVRVGGVRYRLAFWPCVCTDPDCECVERFEVTVWSMRSRGLGLGGFNEAEVWHVPGHRRVVRAIRRAWISVWPQIRQVWQDEERKAVRL